MVRTIVLFSLLLTLGCTKTTSTRTGVLNAVLKVGSLATDVYFAEIPLGDELNNPIPITNGTVIISSDDLKVELTPIPGREGFYSDPNGVMVFEPNESYVVSARLDELELMGSVLMPEPLVLEQVSATEIPVDPNIPNEPIFSVIWDNNNDLSHVLALEHIEENPTEIPFNVPAGNFERNFQFPVTGQGATLLNTDFLYYGSYRLSITAIDQDYESLFFYQAGDAGVIIDQGPENIIGGSGYVVGVSHEIIELELTE